MRTVLPIDIKSIAMFLISLGGITTWGITKSDIAWGVTVAAGLTTTLLNISRYLNDRKKKK